MESETRDVSDPILDKLTLIQAVEQTGPGAAPGASKVAVLEPGDFLHNPLDRRLLRTGCMPWELTFGEFEAELRRIAADAVGAQRLNAAAADYVIGVQAQQGSAYGDGTGSAARTREQAKQ